MNHSKRSRGILKNKLKNSFEESKNSIRIWNDLSKNSIDPNLNSVDMIYIAGGKTTFVIYTLFYQIVCINEWIKD